MGVPKFFRYISERYPCLSEIVREYQIPEFDNLYLDMNGIIHVCSHPNDFDPHFRISEEDIFKDIFNYIETLFRMIQPKKLFFLAVDGVAPRAKMNQQRGRRFKSAKEAEQLEKEALSKGETLPDVERFDSNCITPGTAFMARLQTELKSFITYKINTDKIWRNPTVILSGHETPGEGEHKIMDYIRFLKSKPNYDNNTRHCLYGLDADLIMLGLCTHEPHFSLLREEVKFSKNAQKKRSNAPDEITFFLLHLSLMREYIGLEFQELKKTVKFGFNLEKIIDDWVLMGFLVGNDFIPHLPHLHIANGALPILYQAYIDVLPTLDGHINEDGTLNLLRFQKYMERLSNFDYNQFKDHLVDLKYFEEKTGRKAFRPGETMNDGSGSQKKNSELEALIKETDEFLAEEGIYYSDSSDEDYEDSSLMRAEFQQHKSDYYKNKMEYSEVTKNVLQSQAECYVRAIQWNLNYYYNGCCSWSWFYPHHYAPYMSDIRNFADFKLDFDLGEPFYPFQQLLAVLPAGSKKLLPEPFQELMTDEDSPIIDFYPIDFETDMNGKKQHWEAVVLIPFIDEKKLLKAMESRYDRLTDEEKRRNCHGPMHVFNYTPEDLGSCELPEYFSQVKNNHVEVTTMYREDIYVDKRKLVRGLCKGVKLDTYYPGFPTLKHLKFKGRLEKAGVRVFEQPSQGENMILTLEPKDFHNVKKLANILLDQIVHVRWPHLREARVRAISDGENHYSVSNVSSEKKELVIEKLNSERQELWKAESRTIAMDYKGKLGVKVGETNIIIYATFLEGKKYLYLPNGKVTLKKQWEQVPTPFAFQTVVVNLKVEEDVKGRELTIGDVFKPGGFCFLLVTKFYGDMGLIDSEQCDGKIKLTICNISEPDFKTAKSIAQQLKGLYVTGNVLANKLGVSSHLLSRITGSIFVSKDDSGEPRSRVNVGLNLKFNKRNEEVSGYTKRLQNGMWLYSPKAEELLRGYLDVASDLIRNLSSVVGNDVFTLEDVFPENGEKRLSEISKWLKESTSKLMRQKCGSEVLDEDVIKALEKTIDFLSPAKKTFVIQCKPQFLVLPIVSLGRQCPDPGAEHRLFDRVRSIRESYIVPTGMKGTIIGIHRAEKECDTSYDILYDEVFPGGLSLNGSAKRCCRALKQSFINLSHGQRMANAKQQQSHTQNQETSYRYTNSDARNGPGRNSSAFVSCQDSKEYNKKDEESPFLDALLRKNKSTPKDNQVKLPNKAPQNETQNLNNQSKLEDRLTRNKPQNADPPSDQLRKVLKISDKTPQQVSSSNKPLLDNPPSIPNHADYSCSRELNELCFRNGWRFNTDWHKVHSGFNVEITVSTLNNILAKNSSKGRTAEEALERACYIVLESIKSNFHLQVPYNIFPQQNFNWPSFYPGHQMIPSMRGYPPFRMNNHGGAHTQSSYAIPPPPFQWWCAGDQQTHQRGRRGAGRGAYYANSMPNTSHDNARSQHWEQVDMQPSRWQQENVTRNASYQSDRGQTQSPQNQYQFSQSWSAEQNQIGNPMNHDNSRNISSQRSTNYSTSNQSNQPLTTQQDQTDRMKMQNAPMHHSSHRSTSRPESSNKKREWKLACSFKNAPELD